MFSYQCSFLLLPFHATAFILYQSVSCLSTTFLNYFFVAFLNLSNSNSDILSYIFLLVNNFFEIFSKVIFKQNGERGIRTLAPVARPTPLAGAPLRPLEYFSTSESASVKYMCVCEIHSARIIIHRNAVFVNVLFCAMALLALQRYATVFWRSPPLCVSLPLPQFRGSSYPCTLHST